MFRTLSRGQLITDIVIGAVYLLLCLLVNPSLVFVASSSTSSTSGTSGTTVGAWPMVGMVLVSLIFAGALAVRRLSPPLALTVAWVAAILFVVTSRQMPLMEILAVLMVLYVTSAYGSRRTMWAGLISVGVGAAIVVIYMALLLFVAEPLGDRTYGSPTIFGVPAGALFALAAVFVAGVASMGLAWALGLLKRTRRRAARSAREQAVAEALATAEAQRVQIARDMHDVVAHSLAVVIAQADGARYASVARPEAATDALRTIATTARSALSDVRLLLTQLRHSQGDGPQPTLADLEGLYAHVRGTGVDLTVDVDPAPRTDPPGAIQLAVFRILQEALTNALRHGDGQGIDVHLAWQPDHVAIGVRNRMPSGAVPGPGGGHGLIGMRERAQLVGGRLEAASEEGTFLVRADLPIAQEAEESR